MHVFDLAKEQQWNPARHVEKILGQIEDGDVTVACWEPGQISPNHCHPHATEIYFCYSGGGQMRTPERVIDIVPGAFVVHPPGELHEYINGPQRTMLFRVRYGGDKVSRATENRQHADWSQPAADAEFFRAHPELTQKEL
jgi:quercetin dioxygenase-like cupin family protein